MLESFAIKDYKSLLFILGHADYRKIEPCLEELFQLDVTYQLVYLAEK